MSYADWLFIAGMPRTGTTAMMHALNLHPDCTLLQETHFATGLLDLLRIPADYQGTAGHHRLRLPGREDPCLWSGARLQLYHDPLTTARAMCEGLRGLHGNPAIFGDKSPVYSFSWAPLRALFPGCRVLVMDRGVDETAGSLMRQSWGPDTMTAARAEALRYRDELASCPDTRWVRLEDLKRDPEPCLRRVMQYAGLPWESYPMDEAQALIDGPAVN